MQYALYALHKNGIVSHFWFLEHQNLRTNLQKGFSFLGMGIPDVLSVLRRWTPWGLPGPRCASTKYAIGCRPNCCSPSENVTL